MTKTIGTIELLQVKDYDFQGQFEYDNRIHHCEGEFNIEWDYDIPMARIDSIQIKVGTHWVDLPLERVDNIDSLEEIISETENQDWYADRQADLIDYYYDRIKEEGI